MADICMDMSANVGGRGGRGGRVSVPRSSPPDQLGERRRRFEQIYEAHRGGVLGYALRRVELSEDAADMLSEVFVIAWRRLDQVPDGDAARLWLYATARRVLANHRRGQRRRYERLVSPEALADLCEQITALPILPEPGQTAAGSGDGGGGSSAWRPRPPLLCSSR